MFCPNEAWISAGPFGGACEYNFWDDIYDLEWIYISFLYGKFSVIY